MSSTDSNNNNNIRGDQESQPTPKCGLFCWRPDFLQCVYNWKFALILFCWLSFLHGILTNALNSVNTSSLERRFDVDSQLIGWFSAANVFATASTTLFTSYFADRFGNKPRMLSFAALCYTIGTILMALPHWIMEPYKIPTQDIPAMCYTDVGYLVKVMRDLNMSMSDFMNADPMAGCSNSTSTTTSYFNYLIAGNAIAGVGAAIVWTTGVAFVDDFSTLTKSSFNVGLSYLADAVGTGVGFGVGAVFLTIDVNIDKKGVAAQNTSDANFLGAWWLGYTICIGLFGTVAIAFFFFDNDVPETAKLRAEKLANQTAHVSNIKVDFKETSNKFMSAIASVTTKLLRVITNPVVMFVTFAGTLQNLPVSGLTVFMVKLIQTQYSISEMNAGITLAILIVIGIASGSFISGLLAERLDMSVRSLLLMIVVFTTVSFALGFVQEITCDQEKLLGVTFDYLTRSYYSEEQSFNESSLSMPCNMGCDCDPRFYSPVCNQETGFEFYSACYAGCTHFGLGPASETDYLSFSECQCLKDSNLTSPSSTAQYGICTTGGCPAMYGAMVGIFFYLFCGFFVLVPVTEVIMRTVPTEERSFSLSFSQAINYFLGYIPGPILIGAIFDKTCLLRQPDPCKENTNNNSGLCVTYNSDKLALWLNALLCSLTVVSILLYILAFLLYKPPNGEKMNDYFRHLGRWWLCKKVTTPKQQKMGVENVAYVSTPLENLQSSTNDSAEVISTVDS